MKCETPARSAFSSRDPAPIQKPIATERTWSSRSEMTRSPESSSLRTYFCTGLDRNPRVGDFLHARLSFPLDLAAGGAARAGLGHDLRRGAVAGVVARRRADGDRAAGERARRGSALVLGVA